MVSLYDILFMFRELFEECGLKVNELHQLAILKFEFVGEIQIMEVHVFKSTSYIGTPEESEGN